MTLSAIEVRASELHREAIVIDTLGPGGPGTWTEEIVATIGNRARDQVAPGDLVAELYQLQGEAILRGELPQFWSDWERSGVDTVSTTVGAFGTTPFTYGNAIQHLAAWQRKFDSLPNLRKMLCAADIEAAHESGCQGVILNFQNTTAIEDQLDRLDLFYDLGVRVIQLTYNSRNLVGDGCTERRDGGLSHFGVAAVERMNELGILVDLSHCGRQTTLDALEVSNSPCVISHAVCKALVDHDRAKDDEVLRAVRDTESFFGVCTVPSFITTEPTATLDHWLSHFEHAVEIVGQGGVGIGTDWGAGFPDAVVEALNPAMVTEFGFDEEHRFDWAAPVIGFESWSEWPNFTCKLLEAGYAEDEVRGFVGGNFLNLFERVAG